MFKTTRPFTSQTNTCVGESIFGTYEETELFSFADNTFGNCDNVSGRPLERVCNEIRCLVEKWPDRLTIASTGGSVTGDDLQDKSEWQKHTQMLESTGVHAIEYSLSCPQGGEGAIGNIVSQSPHLSAKIVQWVLEIGSPKIPKL